MPLTPLYFFRVCPMGHFCVVAGLYSKLTSSVNRSAGALHELHLQKSGSIQTVVDSSDNRFEMHEQATSKVPSSSLNSGTLRG